MRGIIPVSVEMLKWLRIVAPAVIIIACVSVLGSLTGLWAISVPTDSDKITKSLGVIFLGGLYYMLPFRDISNRQYFDNVSENIRKRLLEIAGVNDDKTKYTWRKVRGIFFHFIDNDKSLEKKSRLAHFNGFFWTTVADARAICVAFSLIAFGMALMGAEHGLVAAVGFLAVALLSLPVSHWVTAAHKEIGNQQLEIIEQNFKAELRTKLDAI